METTDQDTTREFLSAVFLPPFPTSSLTCLFDRFFNSPDGTEVWNIYHATWIETGNCDGNRYTAAKKVNWRPDGSPDFGQPDPRGTILAGPSGE